jgi:Ca-activated chloride channel family protein
MNGEQAELKEEVVKLSKEFGIMTPYTSWLVMEDLRRNPPPPGAPVPAPNWKGGGEMPNEDRDALEGKVQSGAKAVDAAKRFNAMKEEKKDLHGLEQQQSLGFAGTIKSVAGKTFYKVGDKWIDSTVKADAKPAAVKFLSDDYWALLKDHPELAKYQSLGAAMIVALKDRVIEVQP